MIINDADGKCVVQTGHGVFASFVNANGGFTSEAPARADINVDYAAASEYLDTFREFRLGKEIRLTKTTIGSAFIGKNEVKVTDACVGIITGEDEISVFTNIEDAQTFGKVMILLCAAMEDQEKKTAEAKPAKTANPALMEDGRTPKEKAALLVNCFIHSLVAITCDSKAEYKEMIKYMHEHNLIVTKSVNPDGWNDVCRYVYCTADMGIVKAMHRVPDEADTVMSFSKFRSIAK